MLRPFFRINPSIFTVIFLGVLFANALLWHSPVVGIFALISALGMFGSWAGSLIAPHERGALRTGIGAWTLLSVVMIVGTICYYVGTFSAPAALMLAALLGPGAWLASRHGAKARTHDLTEGPRHRPAATVWIAATIAAGALIATGVLLGGAATTDAVRSVWEVVPPAAFVTFFGGMLALAALLLRGKERALTVPLTALAFFCLISAAVLAFPLGFGFDPFIHQATEARIAEFGTVSPKPFYYVGQYALVLFLHHAFAIPIHLADTLLVPVLAALLLPLAWYGAAAHLLRDRRDAAASLLGLFLLPVGAFILTTPQALANLWTLLIVLAAVPILLGKEKTPAWPLAIPALAAALTHPIAGLPTMLFVTLILLDRARARSKKIAALFWTVAALGTIILPLSFVLNSLRTTGTLGLNLSALSALSTLSALSVFLANRFDPLLDFVYLYGYNAGAILVLVATAGLVCARKTHGRVLRVFAIMAIVLAVNWLLLSSAVDFSFLIDYERQNFSARLVPLALFFLSPFVIVAVGTWAERLRRGPVPLRVATTLLAAAIATSSFYLAYPRHDAYETSHGYNVSAADVSAVHEIEKDAAETPYVVLANQTVSAAAVRELGFARYYGDQFFYPIPTGGELYGTFLTMNDAPSRDTAQDAAAIAAARCLADTACAQPAPRIVYYVVNAYWWQAPRIVETAKATADAWWAIGRGAVHVFRYDLEK